MGSAMASTSTKRDDANTAGGGEVGDLAEVAKSTTTRTTASKVRRMQRRKAKNNNKAATTALGRSGGKAGGGGGGRGRVTLLNESFPPKDSGMRLFAALLFLSKSC